VKNLRKELPITAAKVGKYAVKGIQAELF